MIEIQLLNEKCVKCGACASECPSGVLLRHGEKAMPEVADTANCIGCGHCVAICPTGALRHSLFAEGMVREVNRELLPSPEAVLELIRSRRSNRSITACQVPEKVLQDMLEAARYAPTAENSRKVRVSVLRGADIRNVEDATMRFFLRLARILLHPLVRPFTRTFLKDLYKQAPALESFRRQWEKGERPSTCNATVLLAFTAPAGYDFGWQDCNLAYQNASLMAESHGISQVYMGFVQTACKLFGQKRTAKLLHLPQGHRLYALMGIGVPAFKYSRYTVR